MSSKVELEKLKKDELVNYSLDLLGKYNDLANKYNALISAPKEDNSGQITNLVNENQNLNLEITNLKEAIDQKDTIIANLNIEIKNPKINDINALKKSSDNMISVQFYKVNAYENRVNNSKEYGGREFEIASFTVKYDHGKLTWDVDFKGSELYEPYKESFSNILNEAQIINLMENVKVHGWYKFLKSAMGIPSTFNAKTFFEKFGKIEK